MGIGGDGDRDALEGYGRYLVLDFESYFYL